MPSRSFCGCALDVALRGEILLAGPLELEVDVGRAAGIGHGLHGAEVVLAARAGEEAAEALEVGVAICFALARAIARVQIDTVAVDLPDFDQSIAERVAVRIEHAAREMRDLADRRA